MARGFIPVRRRSRRKTGARNLSVIMQLPDLGLLRSPTGINPLATKGMHTSVFIVGTIFARQ
ncbi:hypothetical protein EMIT0P171_40467 [Pseudomonas sp. IT-P171]